jgi:hypothetical protein
MFQERTPDDTLREVGSDPSQRLLGNERVDRCTKPVKAWWLSMLATIGFLAGAIVKFNIYENKKNHFVKICEEEWGCSCDEYPGGTFGCDTKPPNADAFNECKSDCDIGGYLFDGALLAILSGFSLLFLCFVTDQLRGCKTPFRAAKKLLFSCNNNADNGSSTDYGTSAPVLGRSSDEEV